MKPWREIAVPHPDVLKGTFQQSEFAADITAVRDGQGHARVSGRRGVLRAHLHHRRHAPAAHPGGPAAERQGRRAGHPAADGLRRRQDAHHAGGLSPGHAQVRARRPGRHPGPDRSGRADGRAAGTVAVLDGTAHAPGQPWKHGKQTIRTLWGELAWQLGGEEGFALVKEADANGTSPGKDVLGTLLETYAPCVVLIDELVAYIRQFLRGQPLSGGTLRQQSFVRPGAHRGGQTRAERDPARLACRSRKSRRAASAAWPRCGRLEKTFGRVQALWKPVATEEAFEIVRRRLFEPMRDEKAREAGLPRLRRRLRGRRSEAAAAKPRRRATLTGCCRPIRSTRRSSTGSTRTGRPSTVSSAPAAC